MPDSELIFCRLCMNTQSLTDIYKMDGGDISLIAKINSCINVNLHPEEGLPLLICKACEETIQNFYDYKQKCLTVNLKLKTLVNCSKQSPVKSENYTDTHLENDKFGITLKIENKLDNDFQDSFDFWVQENLRNNVNIKYLQNEIVVKTGILQLASDHTQCSVIKDLNEEDSKSRTQFKHLKTESKSNVFQCELCGRIFNTKTVLKKHLISHSGSKLFSCKLCSKRFTRADHKTAHMRSHMGIRPYICEICGRSFTKRQDLIRHMRIHSDEKKYACPRCDRRFKRSSDVHTHMRTHTGARPYSCGVCQKNYTSHSGLRKHRKTHCKIECSDIK